MTTSKHHSKNALSEIRKAGVRTTSARVSVLNLLLAADHALTHAEIEQASHGEIERVTLYRVLDWLTTHGFAHKVIGTDRAWDFNATSTTEHTHFNCTKCEPFFCLKNLSPAVALSLPDGFTMQHADVAVQGPCPSCSH